MPPAQQLGTLQRLLLAAVCVLGAFSTNAAPVDSPLRVYALRLLPGQELKSSLIEFARNANLKASFIVTCVGSASSGLCATLACFYCMALTALNALLFGCATCQPHEILSLVGTLSPDGAHLHISLGDAQGNVMGGHLQTHALRSCEGAGGKQAMLRAGQLLQDMTEAGLISDQPSFAAALLACRFSRSWQRALGLFAELDANHPDLVTVDMWNRLLDVLVSSSQPKQAIANAVQMAERGFLFGAGTYSLVLGACASLGDHNKLAALVSEMQAADMQLTPVCRFQIISGYASSGCQRHAEKALEAAVKHGDAQPHMFMPLLRACRSMRDVSRARHWLQRSLSLSFAPTADMWHEAVEMAHAAGDADAADALWRDAQAARIPSLYNVMRMQSVGVVQKFFVSFDEPSLLREPHHSALDVSSCSRGVAHAALRAAARELSQARPPAFRYFFTGAFNRKQNKVAEAAVAIMREAGVWVLKVAGNPGLWKAEMAG
ncbi:hypothetical protein JKP88DRAFT_265104 [Tribonema minus]|uniref:PPC domain-containing protein n=1 Tax=Tribonema minus TaxID=303371 RepID=A0A835YLB5_9STRA|nr:hypothetical protein JKP88DRAFT_265104 [Tribonema minus]